MLITFGLLNRYVNHSIYLSSIIFTAIFSIIDTINTTFLSNSLASVLGNIPLYNQGVGWILPAIVGVIVGVVVNKAKNFVESGKRLIYLVTA